MIMLTARGLNQFAMLARTPAGQMLRDFFFSIINGFKRFRDAVERGEVELRFRENERETKRVKVCDTQKALMGEVWKTRPVHGSIYGRINDETNKAVTGMYKSELAEKLGKKDHSVNVRDYMTPAQIAAAELAEMLSAKAISSGSSDDPLATHEGVLQKVTGAIKDMLHTGVEATPLRLSDARATVAPVVPQVADQEPVLNPITNYFARVSRKA